MKSLIELLSAPQQPIQVAITPTEQSPLEKVSVYKQAASVIKTLQTKVAELEEKLTVYEQARELALRLAQTSEFDSFNKFAEFSKKSKAELQVIEKALEYTKIGSVSLGSLSDESGTVNLDPLTSYLMTEIGEK
jgi:hypothetical protein